MLNSIRGHFQTNATLKVVLRQLNKKNEHKFFLKMQRIHGYMFSEFPTAICYGELLIVAFLINNNSLDDVKQSELQVTQVIIFCQKLTSSVKINCSSISGRDTDLLFREKRKLS